jgi:hypothetical protein
MTAVQIRHGVNIAIYQRNIEMARRVALNDTSRT